MVKWMFESHLVATQVKSLISQGFGKSSSIVGFIPEERAFSHPSHVSTQLMISPRLGFQLHQTHRVVPRVFQRPLPQGSPDRDRRLFLQCMLYQLPGGLFSLVADADSKFFGFIGGYGCFFWLLDVAVDDGGISLLHPPLLKRLPQLHHRRLRLRHHQQTASPPIDPVHRTRPPQHANHPGLRRLQHPRQARIDVLASETSVLVRKYHETLGLVDDGDVIVLVDDGEVERGGFVVVFAFGVVVGHARLDGEGISRFYAIDNFYKRQPLPIECQLLPSSLLWHFH
mmetsp:Transcript_2903/g.6496  ORF Transcript_2903/g.6496 Transcript_2903/m.6496 type:complete len:284 (+) Transcript_2903:220-1071(+)